MPIALVFDIIVIYTLIVSIAYERYKISAARNSCHRFMLLTTDVLELVDKR